MTNITVNLKTGNSQPFDGHILVSPVASFNQADGDIYVMPVPDKINLVNGVASFDLTPSDISQTSYHFQILQHLPDEETTDEEGNIITLPVDDLLIEEFFAVIPNTSTINIRELATQTGIRYDQRDTSLLTLARYLYLSDSFWSALSSSIWSFRGLYDPNTLYKRGDIVNYLGSSYHYTNISSTSNVVPTTTSHWQLLASKGDVGTGTTGNTEPFSSTWENSTDAPSRSSLYAYLMSLASQTSVDEKAPSLNPVLTNARLQTAPPSGDYSSLIPSTQWVNDNFDAGRMSIGTIFLWSTSSPPSKCVLLDQSPGSTLSTSVYSELNNLWNGSFNIGGEPAGTFRLPDSASLPSIGAAYRWALYTGI
jgi:hypothetical protein